MTYSDIDVNGTKLDSSKRARKTVRFELDLIKTEEKFIHEILEWWRVQRRMTTNLRKAVLLFYDLMLGKTDRLQEYFPLVVAALTGQAIQDHADNIVGRVTDAIDDMALSITQQMPAVSPERLRALSAQERIAEQSLRSEGTPLIEERIGGKASAEETKKNFLASSSSWFN